MMSSMAGPSGNHRREPVNELTAPPKRGSVDAHPTFVSIIRGPSITPPGSFMPNIVNFVSEPASSMSSPSALSSSCSDRPPSIPCSLVSPVDGKFAEVTGPFFAYPRAGHCEVYSLTTGNMKCFRDRTSSFKWLGFRDGDLQVEHFDRNFQFPGNPAGTYAREIMALYKALLDALYTNYSDRHTTLSINAALIRIQSEIDRHLFSDALILSTVHIIYDFPFLERHIRDGKVVDVKVVVTIEFYQAPWRTGTRRWNRGGSLDRMSVNYHKTEARVQYNFEESDTLDTISDSHLMQPQVGPIAPSHASHQPTALPADTAMNPDALMTYSAQITTITPAPLNAASQGSQAISSLVSGFDLDTDDVSVTDGSMVSLNNVGIDLSQGTPSGTDTLLDISFSHNQLHINPSSSKGILDLPQGSPALSFQQVAQPSFINDGTLGADMSVSLLLPSVTPAYQMMSDPLANPELIENTNESLCVVVSNLQDGDASVNLDAHQAATNPRSAVPAYSRPVRTTSTKSSRSTNHQRARTTTSTTRATKSRLTRSTNPRSPTPTSLTPMSTTQTSTTQTSTTISVKRFPCRYMDCTHKPFATKWSMETHANTHAGVRFSCPYCALDYARPGDRTRHIQKEHLGYIYRCDHCQTERSRKPVDNRLGGCDNNGRKHRYQLHALPSVLTSAVTVDAP